MPTLHLIDADSTQACPAVFSAIRAAMTRSDDAGDCLLILGGRQLLNDAKRAGVDRVHHLPVPFGRAVLGLLTLRRWWRDHSGFDAIHCWSPGALRAATVGLDSPSRRLSLVHMPTTRWIKRLGHLSNTKKYPGVSIVANNTLLTGRLQESGVRCETGAVAFADEHTSPMPDAERRSVRAGWGIEDKHERVVMLLSDHPQLVDAVSAASVVVLGCSTLADREVEPMPVTLLIDPRQANRRHAEALFRSQPIGARIVQDGRVTEPWRVLGACDAALAMGPDAGGLSLRLALTHGIPIVASESGPVGTLDHDTPGLFPARSVMHKDLAHELHRALGG